MNREEREQLLKDTLIYFAPHDRYVTDEKGNKYYREDVTLKAMELSEPSLPPAEGAEAILKEGLDDGRYADIVDGINIDVKQPFYQAIIRYAEDVVAAQQHPPAEGAENIRQLLLGWEHYKRDHFRESEALDVEAILLSEYSQIAAQPQPTAEGAETEEELDSQIGEWAKNEADAYVPNIENEVDFQRWRDIHYGVLRGIRYMRDFATLHAQRIAEKMVEDELRKFVPPEENFPDFDESKKSDPSYCVEWGMLKQRNIERQIWNKAINNLKTREK